MKRISLVMAVAGSVLMFTCGCMVKMGVVGPTWGRGESTYSSGADLHLPLNIPTKVGGGGSMLVFPFEEYRTPVEHQSGFSKGSLRVSSLAGEFRILYMLFSQDRWPKEKAAPDTAERLVMEKAPKLHRHRDKAFTFFWFGAGPEYHWNSFVVSTTDLASAADNNIFYDEQFKNGWGGRFSFGIRTMTRTHGDETGVVTGSIGLNLEVGYHWAYTWIEARGTDNTVPFRRVRADVMSWVSMYAGLIIEF